MGPPSVPPNWLRLRLPRVRARAGYHADHRAGRRAILRAEIAGLHAELGDRVGVRIGCVQVGDVVDVRRAVQFVVDLVASRAVYRYGQGLVGVGVTRGRRTDAGHRAGHHEDERSGVAAVERKVLDIAL